MYSDEQVFVWDIDALREIVKYPHERNLLLASAILRRLLTDSGQPLVHKVARGRDFKPRFLIAGVSATSGKDLSKLAKEIGASFYFSNPDPSFGNYRATHELGLDEFLAYTLYYFDKTDISVKHIINYVANVGGGVHQGRPKQKDFAINIHKQLNSYSIEGMPFPIASIRHITPIVISALIPLYMKIRS